MSEPVLSRPRAVVGYSLGVKLSGRLPMPRCLPANPRAGGLLGALAAVESVVSEPVLSRLHAVVGYSLGINSPGIKSPGINSPGGYSYKGACQPIPGPVACLVPLLLWSPL
ncbi:hypothetical protein [Shewanella litorisediminis]|uniref:Uncharacterized protein n=1 Tax=Shewanella litorisediminis TaxID=1173586 RepID=A0ABX7G598_9GAMM|nr:hypothetical protein [Shewanella litorisediminis]MCL2917382.1 hypothetical protein [Shewanella litorisediminis]QRH02519.1 hypothetical protein JQC75_03590 [Shewanella litorisediminis]